MEVVSGPNHRLTDTDTNRLFSIIHTTGRVISSQIHSIICLDLLTQTMHCTQNNQTMQVIKVSEAMILTK